VTAATGLIGRLVAVFRVSLAGGGLDACPVKGSTRGCFSPRSFIYPWCSFFKGPEEPENGSLFAEWMLTTSRRSLCRPVTLPFPRDTAEVTDVRLESGYFGCFWRTCAS
jgi:hypothetical protein